MDQVDATGVNTPAQDGCPIQSPDGLNLYVASNRPGNAGLDLWVALRESTDGPWRNPVNLNDEAGADLNTSANEFCPTPVRGNGLFFVRRPSSCGLGDIYFARYNPGHGWSEPERLAYAPEGPNCSAAQGGAVPGDIFVSTIGADRTFGPGQLVAELSDPTANDSNRT